MTSTDMSGKLVKRIPGPREFYCDYGLRYPASMGASKGEVLKSILKGVYFDNNRQPFGGCFRDALRYAGFSDYKEVVALYANIKARKENGETASCSFPSGDAEDISGDDEEMVRVLFEKYAEEFFEDATKYAVLRVPVEERC